MRKPEEELGAWLKRYERAWASNDPKDIGSLFTQDSRYYTAPYRKPWGGRQAIIDGWIERKDTPGNYEFRYEILGSIGKVG